jgi:hypothetical protein
MMYVHRCIGVALATLGVLFGGLALASTPALAAGPYTFSKALETPPGGLNGPLGLGVGPYDELFVANSPSKVVDVYNPGSTPEVVSEFNVPGGIELYQLAVDDATATASEVDVYVANLESVIEYAYDPETKTETEVRTITEGLNEPASVATGPEGDLYVGSFVSGEENKAYVNKYSSTGTLITPELVKGLTAPESIAVDSAGNIYVASAHGAFKCSNTGSCAAFGGTEVAKPDNGVTIGPEGDVYIGVEGASAGNFVFIFESNGTFVESFGAEHSIGAPWGIGVVGASVYVTNHAGEVAEFLGKAVKTQPLTVKETGAGKGTVTSLPAGIDCGETCAGEETHKFEENKMVTLSESAATGSEFAKWKGCETEPSGKCAVKMTAAKTVEAEFKPEAPKPEFPVTITAITGKGEVKGEKTIACTTVGIGLSACTEKREETRKVILTETPESGYKFAEWTGVTCENAGGQKEKTCEFKMPAAEVKVQAVFVVTKEFPLTLFITGQGEVKSAQFTATCSTEECVNEVEGEVTLEATAGSGDEFVGWLGCKKTSSTTCKVDVTAATEVTAVFLKAGTQGAAGTNGTDGTNGTNGINGEKGAGAKGATGATGSTGEKGSTGANGVEGPAGANGAAGPAGPAGPAGQIELVTCKKAGKKQKCTTKLVSGTVKFTATDSSAHATLSRHGAVYAAGTESSTSAGMSLRLTPLRKLRPGHYTLTLISGAGKHETIRSESFTLS